jgi:hypothetical protein
VRTLSPSGTVDMPARIAALPFILPSAGVEQP